MTVCGTWTKIRRFSSHFYPTLPSQQDSRLLQAAKPLLPQLSVKGFFLRGAELQASHFVPSTLSLKLSPSQVHQRQKLPSANNDLWKGGSALAAITLRILKLQQASRSAHKVVVPHRETSCLLCAPHLYLRSWYSVLEAECQSQKSVTHCPHPQHQNPWLGIFCWGKNLLSIQWRLWQKASGKRVV